MDVKEAYNLIQITENVPNNVSALRESILSKDISSISSKKYDMEHFVENEKGKDGVKDYKEKFGTLSRSEQDVVVYFAEKYCKKGLDDDNDYDSQEDDDDDDDLEMEMIKIKKKKILVLERERLRLNN